MNENVYISDPGNLSISLEAANRLRNISKWTKFLSILAMVMIGLAILGILGAGSLISSVNFYEMSQGAYPYVPGTFSWLYAGLYIILLLVYAVPFYYLYNFSVRIKKALDTNNMQILSEAIRFLEKHFMFIGIMAIIWLILVVFTIILTAVGFSAMM